MIGPNDAPSDRNRSSTTIASVLPSLILYVHCFSRPISAVSETEVRRNPGGPSTLESDYVDLGDEEASPPRFRARGLLGTDRSNIVPVPRSPHVYTTVFGDLGGTGSDTVDLYLGPTVAESAPNEPAPVYLVVVPDSRLDRRLTV